MSDLGLDFVTKHFSNEEYLSLLDENEQLKTIKEEYCVIQKILAKDDYFPKEWTTEYTVNYLIVTNRSLENDNKQILEKYGDLEMNNINLSNLNTKLKNYDELLQKKYDKLTIENNLLKDKINNVMIKNNFIKNNLDNLAIEHEYLKDKNNSLEIKYKNLTNQHNSLNICYDSLEHENDDLSLTIKNLTKNYTKISIDDELVNIKKNIKIKCENVKNCLEILTKDKSQNNHFSNFILYDTKYELLFYIGNGHFTIDVIINILNEIYHKDANNYLEKLQELNNKFNYAYDEFFNEIERIKNAK